VNRCTFYPPMQDRRGVADTFRFGSQHPSGVNVVQGDGSVRNISYNVDPAIYMQYGSISSTAAAFP